MSALDRRTVLLGAVGDGFDEDIMEYLCGVLEEMSMDELRSAETLAEVVAPFLVSTGSHDEDEATRVCRLLAQSFGGSGYATTVKKDAVIEEQDAPMLLSAPIKMADTREVKQLTMKHTYGGTQVTAADGSITTNTDFEADQTMLAANKSGKFQHTQTHANACAHMQTRTNIQKQM